MKDTGLHAHHDVQTGLAHLPQGALFGGAGHLHHRTGQLQVAHQLGELRQFGQLGLSVLAGELDQEYRFGTAYQRTLYHRPEGRIAERQFDHGAIDQFHRRRRQLDDMLGRVHGLIKRREVHHPEDLVRGDRGKRQGHLPAIGQGSLRAHQ
jgi:hypothetical protein